MKNLNIFKKLGINSSNIFTDKKKMRLIPEFNYMKVSRYETCQYNDEYLELYQKKAPTIIQFSEEEIENNAFSSSFFLNNF